MRTVYVIYARFTEALLNFPKTLFEAQVNKFINFVEESESTLNTLHSDFNSSITLEIQDETANSFEPLEVLIAPVKEKQVNGPDNISSIQQADDFLVPSKDALQMGQPTSVEGIESSLNFPKVLVASIPEKRPVGRPRRKASKPTKEKTFSEKKAQAVHSQKQDPLGALEVFKIPQKRKLSSLENTEEKIDFTKLLVIAKWRCWKT